jgi:tripartite-type tricarboxylate transporter receptor subunit TctC
MILDLHYVLCSAECGWLHRARALFFLSLFFCAVAAWAQSPGEPYPARAVKFIVPYPPGGSPDVIARGFAERLQASFRQPVIVENKPGAGTLLAAEYVARSPADGYMLMLATSTAFGINPNVNPKWSVDPVKDFTFVSLLGWSDFFLVTSPAFPANNLKELIELARKKPGEFNYGSVGNGTTHHLFMEILKSKLGLDVVHIPYKGSVSALPDLFTNKIQMMFLDFSVAVPYIQAGKLKGLGTTMAAQNTLIGSVPPIEALVPGFDWAGWQGITGPAGMPRQVVARIAEVIRSYQTTQDYLDLMRHTGMVPVTPMLPDTQANFLKTEFDRWGAAIKASGATFD